MNIRWSLKFCTVWLCIYTIVFAFLEGPNKCSNIKIKHYIYGISWSWTITFYDYDYNCSPKLSPRLDLPGFWPGIETKREVRLLQSWFGLAPVNKLVSLAWLLWALKRFWRLTLHSIMISLQLCTMDACLEKGMHFLFLIGFHSMPHCFKASGLHWALLQRLHVYLNLLQSSKVSYSTQLYCYDFIGNLTGNIRPKCTHSFPVFSLYHFPLVFYYRTHICYPEILLSLHRHL